MTTFIWKPSTISSWKNGIAFLAPSESSGGTPTVTDSSGKVYSGKFINDNEGRKQWIFPSELAGFSDLTLHYGDTTTKIGSGSQSYEGNDLTGWQPRDKGSVGSSGVTGPFAPGQAGQYGFYPSYLGGEFPSPTMMQTAPYNFTDPFKFAAQYGDFSRKELQKNFNQSQDMALSTLQTELQGLNQFIPAASALKRSEVSADNQFNQQQRTQQLNQVLPNAVGDLNAQAERARAYAEGRVPDAVQNQAFELGIRSAAADRASGGGFGASSSAARKISDLMSAEQRIQLSQYGDKLLSSNIRQAADLELAPTEYSNAGSQINVNPSLSPSQLQQANFGTLNQYGAIAAPNALSAQVQQNQFTTGLQQQTNQINTANSNAFKLDKFGYDVSYAGSVAGASQTNANTNLQLQQQQQYMQLMQQYMQQAQNAAQLQSIFSGASSIFSGLGGISGIANLFGGSGGGGLTGGAISSAASAIGAPSGIANDIGSLADAAAPADSFITSVENFGSQIIDSVTSVS